MTSDRVNPFSDASDLPTLEPKPRGSKPAPVLPERIEALARANGFPSRQVRNPGPTDGSQAATQTDTHVATRKPEIAQYRPFRHRSSNQQINVKAAPEVIDQFHQMAASRGVPLGELLRLALDALAAGGKP